MPIPSDAFVGARKLKPKAVAQVLASVYAGVYRLAHGLAGRADVGQGIVRYVMARSVHVMPKWEDEAQAEQWFSHFTILTARRAIKHPPDPKKDLFVTADPRPDLAYVGFIKALRGLPHQQMEAFILHHGEKLNMRYMAVAMDCSVEAAHNHLRSATGLLRKVSAEYYDNFIERLGRAYARQTPKNELVIPRVKTVVLSRVWPRRIGRWMIDLLILALAAGLVWAVWKLYPMVEF